MACSTCSRRNKSCDKRRPRCGPCKVSHLRCTYPRPPGVFTFVAENGARSPKRLRGGDSVPLRQVAESQAPTPTPAASLPAVVATPISDVVQTQLTHSGLPVMLPSPWHDDFYYDFNTEPFHDINFHVDIGTTFQLSTEVPGGSISSTPNSTQLSENNAPPDNLTPRIEQSNVRDAHPLPGHILAQHYSSELAKKYSFKSSEWTFYTYFFHRFTQSHPWVLFSIQAWTSTHLFYSGKIQTLTSAEADYSRFVDHMRTQYGVSHETFGDGDTQQSLASAPSDDIDAIFVGHFFLALADLMATRPVPFRGILNFAAHLLRIPNIKAQMTGVRSRVASWFCILDAKASAFQRSDGTVLEAIGGESGLTNALNDSYLTLQQAYSLTYPDEQRKGDAEQLPLLQRMLSLAALLHDITQIKHTPEDEARPAKMHELRTKIDIHRDAIMTLASSDTLHGLPRARSTFLVLSALYHSVEISSSRSLCPEAPRHAASDHARHIVKLAQELTKFHPSRNSPPPTKFWPLPIVMAAIEVDDIIYREWAIDRLRSYEKVGGNHYVYATKFVELVCATEDNAGVRVDWEPIMASVKDGLII